MTSVNLVKARKRLRCFLDPLVRSSVGPAMPPRATAWITAMPMPMRMVASARSRMVRSRNTAQSRWRASQARIFRFATDAELDALDAFQRWLGRRSTPSGGKEFALADLLFADERIEQGKDVYRSPQATCNACHTNGGGSFGSINNVNLNTGVESELERLNTARSRCATSTTSWTERTFIQSRSRPSANTLRSSQTWSRHKLKARVRSAACQSC